RPLEDQQIAGVTMALEQAAVFFAVFAAYLLRSAREVQRDPELFGLELRREELQRRSQPRVEQELADVVERRVGADQHVRPAVVVRRLEEDVAAGLEQERLLRAVAAHDDRVGV